MQNTSFSANSEKILAVPPQLGLWIRPFANNKKKEKKKNKNNLTKWGGGKRNQHLGHNPFPPFIAEEKKKRMGQGQKKDKIVVR